MKRNGFVWFVLIMMLLTVVLSFYKSNYDERKRTKDYKTVEEWAVEIAKENFFYIRESDEVYLYTIEEVYVGNFDYEGDDFGKYFRAFKIVMMEIVKHISWQSHTIEIITLRQTSKDSLD